MSLRRSSVRQRIRPRSRMRELRVRFKKMRSVKSNIVIGLLVLVVAGICFLAAAQTASVAIAAVPQTDPSASLSRGRALLKQGHADQALPLLESALNSFTQTNNARGIAAAEDALGDLYMIQGQYKVALDHFQNAYKSFVVASGKDQTGASAANNIAGRAGSTASAATQTAESTLDNGFNANLMLAKIGDTNYRLGQMSEASTAYFMMNVKKPETAGAKVTRRFGGPSGIGGSISRGRVDVATPTRSA